MKKPQPYYTIPQTHLLMCLTPFPAVLLSLIHPAFSLLYFLLLSIASIIVMSKLSKQQGEI
jgi:hypothetical protein